ncbi:MAG: dTDP-4-dehydrorhamnose 3,5-epimerase [Calditrichaeota bacterium]|nr:dTDP-4-dehydrorhamnose 3,5-epimerase [Calditrichota bacterium]
MNVTIEAMEIPEVKLITPDVFEDHRGYFTEAYHERALAEQGVDARFVQINESGSARNVVRGLHFQWDPPMGKLMRVTSGAAFIVAVDIRHNSPTLGRWVGIEASRENRRQIYAPASFARGLCVLSEFATVEYLCTGHYNGACESGIRWNDPEIGIEWPVTDPILSDRDRDAQTLRDWLAKDVSKVFSA